MNVNKFQRGQIWWWQSNTNYDGSIQGKTRPVVIISNNKANENSNNLIAIPCTSQIKRMDMKTHIKFNIDNVENIALCESLFNVNINKLTTYIGTCDSELIDRLEDGVRIALGLKVMEDNTCYDKGPASSIINQTPIKNPDMEETPDIPTLIKKEEPEKQKRGRKPNYTIDEKIRFLNDCENHTSDYMLKKYNLTDKQDLAKKKYSFRKQLEAKGEVI